MCVSQARRSHRQEVGNRQFHLKPHAADRPAAAHVTDSLPPDDAATLFLLTTGAPPPLIEMMKTGSD